MSESDDNGNFESRALLYLRSGLPAEEGEIAAPAFTDDELLEVLHSSMERCGKYGLTTEQQILNFTAASCLLGEEFDADPENEWVPDVLNDPVASPDERAALLLAIAATIVEEAADEVAAAEEKLEKATAEESGGA
jgi:hypothetical protein